MWAVDRVDMTKRSSLGNVIFTWRHYVQFCASSTTVTAWQVRSDYLVAAQSGVYMRSEGSSNWQSGIGTSNATSFRQQHLEYCVVKFGCYHNVYPWSRINIFGNGNFIYSTGGL